MATDQRASQRYRVFGEDAPWWLAWGLVLLAASTSTATALAVLIYLPSDLPRWLGEDTTAGRWFEAMSDTAVEFFGRAPAVVVGTGKVDPSSPQPSESPPMAAAQEPILHQPPVSADSPVVEAAPEPVREATEPAVPAPTGGEVVTVESAAQAGSQIGAKTVAGGATQPSGLAQAERRQRVLPSPADHGEKAAAAPSAAVPPEVGRPGSRPLAAAEGASEGPGGDDPVSLPSMERLPKPMEDEKTALVAPAPGRSTDRAEVGARSSDHGLVKHADDCAPVFSVNFQRGSAQPAGPELRARVARLTSWLLDHPDAGVLVEGHADAVGPEEFNLLLSYRRANAVTNLLTEAGVPHTQLTAVAYGESRPLEQTARSNRDRRVSMSVNNGEECPSQATRGEKAR